MRTQAIRSRENPNLELIAFHGHFATRLSASSWYTTLGVQLRSPVIGRPSNRSRNCKNGNAREK